MLLSNGTRAFSRLRCTSTRLLHSCAGDTYDSAAPRRTWARFFPVMRRRPERSPMNREKLAWTLSVVLVAVLAFQLPGSMAARDSDYAWVSTLVDIHRRVADNYVEPVDE